MIYPVVFLPVLLGGFDYWQGWLFAVAYSIGTLLFKRRGPAGPWAETDPEQKRIAACILTGSLLLLVIPPLAHRLSLCQLPWAASLVGAALLFAGWSRTIEAFNANPHAHAVVQRPVSVRTEGPYAGVRHPMYQGSILLALGTALTLGCWGVFPIAGFLAGTFMRRIEAEERLLQHSFVYRRYMDEVRWRLIRGVW